MKRIIGIPSFKKSKKSDKDEQPDKDEKPKKPPKPPAPTLSTVVEKIDNRANETEKKIAQCEVELKKLAARMKNLPNGSAKNALKSKAYGILQRKKAFEQQEETLRQQSFNIEQTTNAVVAAKDATQIVKLMKQGVKELKKEQKKVTVESVEDLHDELSQLFENADDIQNVFAENLHMPPIDDQELADQLELLGDELATDNDTSYLDEATGGSTPPAGPSVTLDMPNNTQPSSGSGLQVMPSLSIDLLDNTQNDHISTPFASKDDYKL